MGFLAPVGAAIGSALGAIGGGSAIAGAATVAGLATAGKSLLSGAPKAPTVAAIPPAQAITPPNPAPQSPTPSISKGTSLAQLAPGLALGGTAGFLGQGLNKGGKTLLGG